MKAKKILSQAVNETVSLNRRIIIEEFDYEKVAVRVVDRKSGIEFQQIVPCDNHLDEKLADIIVFTSDKLTENLSYRPKKEGVI